MGPIDTTQRHVVDSVGDTKNHVGDIGLMSPHADRVVVVSFRTNPDMFATCRQKTPNSSTTIYYRQHNHPHHGERPPAPSRSADLKVRPDPTQTRGGPVVGGGVGRSDLIDLIKWQTNKFILCYSIILKKIKLTVIDNESDGHAAGLIRRESHRSIERFIGFMRSH